MKKELTLRQAKETKGTVVYEEIAPDDNPIIGSLYVKKPAMAGARPAQITVTIAWN